MGEVDQLELPLRAWDEDAQLRSQEGKTLERWGSVKMASRILFGMDRAALYRLIRLGEIRGIKLGTASNSHYKVDLLSAWEYRARMMGEGR